MLKDCLILVFQLSKCRYIFDLFRVTRRLSPGVPILDLALQLDGTLKVKVQWTT